MVQKSVIIVCRSESMDDFHQIARRAHRLDPSITVIPIAEHLHSSLIPKPLLNLPMLVIFLVNPPDKEFHVAGKMAVKHITKLEEYEHFKKHNIPCLPIEDFTWGMALDKSIYGDWVVLKPQTIQSTGKDVNMVPTDLIPTLTLEDFPADHLIRQDQYYVQKFVKTGDRPRQYRAIVFLGAILHTKFNILNFPYPNDDSNLNTLLRNTVASNYTGHREAILTINDEFNEIAIEVAKKFSNFPLLGLDMIQDPATKKIYVLETNSGGNTWHFSSQISKKLGFVDPAQIKPMILQYKAWDKAAEALIQKTHEFAK